MGEQARAVGGVGGEIVAVGVADQGAQRPVGAAGLAPGDDDLPDGVRAVGGDRCHAGIGGLESGIADRRELYNEAVNLNNVRIEQFPDVVLARLFAFQAAELLRFSEAEKADVDLKQLFS